MSSFLRVGLVPAQGTGSTSSRCARGDRELLKNARSLCITCSGLQRFDKLTDRLRDEGHISSGIQKIIGGVTSEEKGKKSFLYSSSYFGSHLILGSSWKCRDSWHVEALKDGSSFRTGHSASDLKVAKENSSSSAASLSPFDVFCQVCQDFAQQNMWITLLHPLQLDAQCGDEMDDSGKEALSSTQRKVLSKFSSILSSFSESTAALGGPDAIATAGAESATSEKDILFQPTKKLSPTSAMIADELCVALNPAFDIPNSLSVENVIPLQGILYNPFRIDSKSYNSHISLLNKSELTLIKQRKGTHLSPSADLCEGPHVTAEGLGSMEALAKWLKERLSSDGLQLSLWGKAPGTKSVSNLWYELVDGEMSLEDSCPPRRTVHVASVHIMNESGSTLVEAYQEMSDGRIRQRNRPLSEKMRPGENVEDACLRGIYEELGWHLGAHDRVSIFQDSYRRIEEERESNSYPGLLTRYIIHTMSAHVNQLPATEFFTFEDENHQISSFVAGHSLSDVKWDGETSTDSPVGVKRHFWKWV